MTTTQRKHQHNGARGGKTKTLELLKRQGLSGPARPIAQPKPVTIIVDREFIELAAQLCALTRKTDPKRAATEPEIAQLAAWFAGTNRLNGHRPKPDEDEGYLTEREYRESLRIQARRVGIPANLLAMTLGQCFTGYEPVEDLIRQYGDMMRARSAAARSGLGHDLITEKLSQGGITALKEQIMVEVLRPSR
ncbi:hypothetical protein HGA91_01665 [candidate division WWE3 bacterium]|nr:hypothetical protein [candidate division WWE3 bacterium]